MDKSGFKCVSSGFMLISGVGLCVAAFCVEPVGEIHDSVLWYFAQPYLCGFCRRHRRADRRAHQTKSGFLTLHSYNLTTLQKPLFQCRGGGLIAESEVLLGRDDEIEISVTIKDELGGPEDTQELF